MLYKYFLKVPSVLIIVFALFFSQMISSQTPGLSYQALIANSDNVPVVSTEIDFRFTMETKILFPGNNFFDHRDLNLKG